MKARLGLVAGLILFGVGRLSLYGEAAEIHSMREVTENGTPPTLIKRVEPEVFFKEGEGQEFHALALRPIPGRVVIDFVVDDRGRVRNPRAVSFSNSAWIEPAMEALKAWRYTPGKIKDKPVHVALTAELGSNGQLERVRFQRSSSLQEADKGALPAELQWERAPILWNAVYPVYPRAAVLARQEGAATIKFVVGADGRVTASQLLEASTREMGQAGRAAIETWEFLPARKGEQACAAVLLAHFRFRRHGHDSIVVSEDTRRIFRILEKNPERVAAAGDLDRPLKPVVVRDPAHPLDLINRAGEVVVEFVVDADGLVQLPGVVSSTAPEFGCAAVQAVATWRFDVPRVKGKPVATRARWTLVFLRSVTSPPPG